MFDWNQLQRDASGQLELLYRHQRVFDEGLIHPQDRVLDVGGWGVLAKAVSEYGAQCAILDLFTVDQYYPDRVRALPHVQGDARDRHHFVSSAFDVVTCFEMLEHCGDIARVVGNIAYWLRPGGVLVGTMPIPGRTHAADEPGIVFLIPLELRNLLTEAGFEVERIEPTGSVCADEEPCSFYFVARKPNVPS